MLSFDIAAKRAILTIISRILFILLLISSNGVFAHGNYISTSVGYNPDSRFDDDARVLSTRAGLLLAPNVMLSLDHRLLKQGNETQPGYGVGLALGSTSSTLVRMHHSFSDNSDYMARDKTRLFLLRRLKRSQTAGFYEASQAYYSFSTFRQLEMSAGHLRKGEWVRLGVAGAFWRGSDRPQVKIFFAINNQYRKQSKRFSAKLYLGTHQRVVANQVLDTEQGLHFIVQGDLRLPFAYISKRFNVTYRYNALLVENNFDTGVSLGLKYRF